MISWDKDGRETAIPCDIQSINFHSPRLSLHADLNKHCLSWYLVVIVVASNWDSIHHSVFHYCKNYSFYLKRLVVRQLWEGPWGAMPKITALLKKNTHDCLVSFSSRSLIAVLRPMNAWQVLTPSRTTAGDRPRNATGLKTWNHTTGFEGKRSSSHKEDLE